MKHLIFDLDDTLIPSTEGYMLALDSIGIKIDSVDYLEARERTKKKLTTGHVSARNRWLYLKDYLEAQNSFSPGKLITLMEKYESVLSGFISSEWKRLRRDELFMILKSKASLSILTNENTRAQMLKLNSIDPDGKYFTSICTSEEFGREKPDLKLFNEFHSRIGRPDPTTITFIGDNVFCDLAPAHSLGWKTILTTEFSREGKTSDGGYFTRISNLNQLVDIL